LTPGYIHSPRELENFESRRLTIEESRFFNRRPLSLSEKVLVGDPHILLPKKRIVKDFLTPKGYAD
jgi:hypothetical protein